MGANVIGYRVNAVKESVDVGYYISIFRFNFMIYYIIFSFLMSLIDYT